MLSREEMVGQRLMLGFDGTGLNDDLKRIIGELKAGGLILFKRNIKDPDQISRLCGDCQDYARACGLPPLFIAVDQEGGTVARFEVGFTRFEGNPSIQSVAEAREFARITADEVKAVGINMNMAPVLDTVDGYSDSIMKDRAFKGNARQVSELGMEVINIFQSKGIMAVAKHFPGIGRTILDSHFHLPVLDEEYESLEKSDMIPFKDAIEGNVAGVMLSHILYPKLDEHWQASLSPSIAGEILRDELGYDGLVMTDDLDMKAIKHDMAACINQILSARIDIILICHKGPNIDIAANEMNHLIEVEPMIYDLAKDSVKRILKYKDKYLR